MFTKKEPAAVKAAREAAISAAKAMQEAEAKLAKARATGADAAARVTNLGTLLQQLRDKAAAHARDAELDEAGKLAQPIADAKAALEAAQETARTFGAEVIEGLEIALFEAEKAAERAHMAYHSAAETAMRPELVELIKTRFRTVWRHSQAGGQRVPFKDWLDGLMRDAAVHANENLFAPVDLGHDERPPRSEALGREDRRRIEQTLFDREQAEQEAAFYARQAEAA
ncbi:MAG: hypothetical protein H6988_12530 [Pseudomonadales bacterium]|nr:hypothetical protein [Pseudomonadales bacterium]